MGTKKDLAGVLLLSDYVVIVKSGGERLFLKPSDIQRLNELTFEHFLFWRGVWVAVT